MPQRARIFEVNCCLRFHNAHQKVLLPISAEAQPQKKNDEELSNFCPTTTQTLLLMTLLVHWYVCRS